MKKEGIKRYSVNSGTAAGNANWWSIIGNGLYLRPTNVKISGKMLGYGLYFANNVAKSITYTSRSSYSYYHEPTGFLAIMQVAYGNHTISMNLIPSIMTLTGNIYRISVQERTVYMHTKAWIQDGADYEMMRSSCTKKNRQRLSI